MHSTILADRMLKKYIRSKCKLLDTVLDKHFVSTVRRSNAWQMIKYFRVTFHINAGKLLCVAFNWTKTKTQVEKSSHMYLVINADVGSDLLPDLEIHGKC